MSKVDLAPAARRLAELVARTEDDELGRPTPCPAYTVGDLIEHIGGQARSFAAAARKELSRPVPKVSSKAHRGERDPLSQLDMRLTYRTVRVLLAVAAQPGDSNRGVAARPRSFLRFHSRQVKRAEMRHR